MPRLAPVAIVALALLAPLFPATATHSPEPWNTVLDVTIHGEAGDWVFLYHALPTPIPERVGIIHNWTFTATAPGGEPLRILLSGLADIEEPLSPLNLARPSPTDTPSYLLGGLRLVEQPDGGTFYKSSNLTAGYNGFGVDARAMLASANAPWTLHVRLEAVDGNPFAMTERPTPIPVEPTMLLQGSSASFWSVDETALAGPIAGTGYSAGRVTARLSIDSPGWTHIQYDFDNAPQPWGSLHAFHAGFPNGYRFVGLTVHEGQPINGGEPGMIRAIGTMQDKPGTLTLDILRADPARNARALAVHLPLDPAALPARMERWDYGCSWALDEMEHQSWGERDGGCLSYPGLGLPPSTL